MLPSTFRPNYNRPHRQYHLVIYYRKMNQNVHPVRSSALYGRCFKNDRIILILLSLSRKIL